jgi:hypothetical protein
VRRKKTHRIERTAEERIKTHEIIPSNLKLSWGYKCSNALRKINDPMDNTSKIKNTRQSNRVREFMFGAAMKFNDVN